MSPHPPEYETFASTYEEETFTDTLIRNFQTKPAVISSLGAMSGALGYGFYRWRTKGFLVSPSLFLIQLRVGAQSAAIGCIIVAMTYNLVDKYIFKKPSKE
ncbi:uncharacterized protein LOC106645011 [Copidosoma floridanum]|uniref:uncharacterized protein LOC106645011 n=1 Tax=Copidosoma floridanum TaxID=29053 RepID=UPI0006C9C677|nr:uncharacterized protein LOC106645011 [Copidosoma floridanum]XP_014216240.1 uncharacterized protein LOC106645011 [Copidosoma floridanum]XP_014216241.1 uncharacterized protein LOC106645011 [Copidosoma floridanum]XP_014216242.1 uncharacterized protein LOC106645011 [Copidosoma floridanum]